MKSVKVLSVIVVLMMLCGLLAGCGGDTGPNFKRLYGEYCSLTWADVGSDGSYLSIDTNPYDEEDNGIAYPDAYYAVEDVNEALGLPESLINEMGETTGADGKQSQDFEDIGVTVSWKYHPDYGLEVTYKKMK